MRKALIFAFLQLLLSVVATAQDPYEYFYNNSSPDEQSREIVSDMSLFLRPIGGRGALFRSMSEFNFSAVKYNRRGYEQGLTRDFWGSIDFSGLVSRSTDFGFLSILRRGDFVQADNLALSFGLNAATNEYPWEVRSVVQPGARASVFAYNRRGRLGGRFSVAGEGAGGKAYYGIAAGHRWGRDPNVGGVFAQEPWLFTGLDLQITDDHHISLLFGATATSNGMRSYATREAFELTGDNLYNPSWGWYDGRERSAKTIETLRAYPLITYAGRLTYATNITISAYYGLGIQRRGGLAWFNAQTPWPDYYRYMPGYEPSNPARGWLDGDPRITQIFWEQLVEQNLNRPEQAAYVLADGVERNANFQIAATATTVLEKNLTLTYGVRHNDDGRKYYREVRNMLGANPMPDVDQYLLDDDIFGNYHLNDVRNPTRLVGEGDRFGYNYRLRAVKTDLFAAIRYKDGRLQGTAALEVGQGSLQREGLYEKEIFPGSGSYGHSGKFSFNPYTARISVRYAFSARHFLGASALAAETMPYAGTVFMNPDYANYTIARPQTVRILSANADYMLTLDRFALNVSAFTTRTSGESAIYRYWDDIEATFADMSLEGVEKLYYGAEIAAQIDLSPQFTFNFATSVGRYTYDSDPHATIVNDATQHTMLAGSRSRLKGYNLATSPQRAVTGELRYAPWGWITSFTASYMGGRYVDVSPLRRMERAYGLAESPEKHREFVDQERLGNAFVMNFFLLRSFPIRRGTLTVTASVNNLLGDTGIIYNGYEQMRIVKNGTAPNHNWKPFPSKYLYGYGRTWYLSLSYSF